MAQGIFFFFLFFQFKKFKSNIFSPDDTNTSYSADDPLAEMRSIIDRDIARLEESIRALKSRRNELSPIARLPVEILCNIFSLIEDNSIFYLGRSPKSWINFSHVSRHWRSSALNAPELWTKIPLGYPRWAQEMLIRSKKAKLTIRSNFSLDELNPQIIKTVRSCLHEMNRVEEINLTVFPGLILEEVFWDLPKSAPQLHTLCIDSFHYSGTAFSIDKNFLYDTERLQCVELINCKISWDSLLLTGLTRLTLEDSLQANSSIIDFLHALQRMPALTHLCLKDSIPDDSESSSTYPVVDLPCLRILRMTFSISSVGALTTVLRHITFPHIDLLNLTCRENQSTQIGFSNFLVIVTKLLLSSFVIRSLRLGALNHLQTDGLRFDLWTAAIVQGCFPPPPVSAVSLIQLGLTWPCSPPPHNHAKALTCAFDAMSLHFLTQLQISNLDYIDSQTWVKTFGKLPRLELVWVQSDAPLSFLEALVYKRKRSKRVSFRKLRSIYLEGTVFATSPRSVSIDMLLDCLMERCERKAEVQVLSLDDCYYISSDDVKRLKEIVVEVNWDGIEQEISEDDSEDDDSDGSTTTTSSSSSSSSSSEEMFSIMW